jgi:hypothetical protein
MIPIDMGFRSRALLSKISLCEKGNSCKIVPQEWDSRVWVGLVSARTRTFDRTRAGVLPVHAINTVRKFRTTVGGSPVLDHQNAIGSIADLCRQKMLLDNRAVLGFS